MADCGHHLEDDFICVLSLLYSGEARVKTEVQAGPLYRVLGSPLYITCSVSGFRSENTDKHFEFRMTKPSNPDFEIQIISSHEDTFGYSSHLTRVRKNEIALKRLSPNSVRFEIKSLQKTDEGEYECTAVNLEGVYDGEYSDKTVVKVIEDSLSVSSSASTPLSLNEGEALTLTCLASSSTIQHTHLSVAWYLHKDGQEDAQPIISLNRDFTLSPGQGFERRYQAGLIRLDKWGEASYSLKMAEVEPSDQGRIYCQAQEWIQDPDGSWYIIIQKNAEEMTLTVKATVEISAQPAALQEGQELMLSCNINTQDVEKRFFSVAWLKGSVELARIGPTGVLTVAPEYSVRQKNGELRAARSGNRDYRLILKPVRTEDQGEYICTVWPQERGQDDTFIEGEPKDSSPQRVSVSATGVSKLTVKMQQAVNVAEGGGLHLFCKVDGVQGQLSVTWQLKSTPTAPFTEIISISQEGVTEIAEEFVSRKVKVMRPTTDNFTLALDEVTLSDSGVYQCAVSERKPNSKTHNQAQTTTVTVTSIDTLMGVSLSSRKTRVTVGEKLELMCRVKGPHMPVTVTWSVQREAKTPDTILTLSPDGTISWSADQNHYQLRVESRKTEVMYYLLVIGTSHREGGSYQCNVSVLLKNVHKELKASNQLDVSPIPALTTNMNTDITITCSIVKKTSESSLYSITWLHEENAGNKTIVSLDRNSIVTESQVDLRQRISMRRSKGPTFELIIRQARISDKGLYTCKVGEWLQDPRGEWYLLSTVSKSTVLTITEPENNLSVSKKDTAMNISRNQDFTFPCNINKQSSNESKFQVTWFWQKEIETKQRPIFTVYRNSILQHRFGENVRLRYDHPDPSQFSLTFLNPGPDNSGLYFCEVEEWLPSLSRGWRKVAVEKSGHFNVSVRTEGRHVLTHLVISLRKNSSSSLWAESVPMNNKPSGDD
uniref:Immunoglobulin superfamily member 3 n=1 Tax=Maylandia zebra TaxID=106582 RepID=A0A3P9AZ09_9CICH